MAYRFLLRDISALAYSSDAAALSTCRLTIKYSERPNQASIILGLKARIHGFEDEQAFDLVYDANNLKPCTSFLRPTTEDLSEAQRTQIARNNKPTAKTLCLTLLQPCLVRCPRSTGCVGIAPKLGYETPLFQLRELARALEIYVIFDHNCLRTDSYAAFHRLVNNPPENLVGIPAEKYQGPLSRQANWTVFIPIEEDAAPEVPPLYTDVVAKRPATNSSREPPPKRKRASPSQIEAVASAPFNPLLGSPTEKATTATPSPSPCPSSPDLHDVVGNAVETMVPQILQQVLPSMLSDLFAVSPSPVSDHDATTIGARITARIVADARPGLEKMLAKIERDTNDCEASLRQHAAAEFFEEIENYKVDVSSAKEDGLTEIRQEFQEIMQELTNVANAMVEQLSEDMQGLVHETLGDVDNSLNELVEKKMPSLQKHVRKILEQEKNRAGSKVHASRDRRAISLPP